MEGPYEFNPNETYDEFVFNEKWKHHRSREYSDYREQWAAIPAAKTELEFPIHLDIETTNVCNLKCPMCPRTEMVAKGVFGEVGAISRERYASIIDQGAAHGIKSIKLNYLGEPLVHEDVVWQVEYAKQKGVLDVMMNTNATALSKKMSRNLLAAGIDNLFISFDAISPRLFEQQRVGTSIGKVIDNVYNFVKLRDENYPHVQIRASMVMYKDPAWMEQFEGLKIMWKDAVDAIGYGFYTERDPDKRGEFDEVPGFWCAQLYQRMFLKYNGNVTICCVDDKDETVVGNWHELTLKEIWQGSKYREIRRQHTEGRYYEMPMCRKCYLPGSS
jgi:radical SAM protein with 4Fe4S-binding SPASM domain